MLHQCCTVDVFSFTNKIPDFGKLLSSSTLQPAITIDYGLVQIQIASIASAEWPDCSVCVCVCVCVCVVEDLGGIVCAHIMFCYS